jgi:hypothetical protein
MHTSERQKKAESDVTKDLQKETKDLLIDVHNESLCEPMDRPSEQTTVRTTARFASLLALLATRSENFATRAEVLQRRIIALTIALLIFTIGLIIVGVAQLRSSYVLEGRSAVAQAIDGLLVPDKADNDDYGRSAARNGSGRTAGKNNDGHPEQACDKPGAHAKSSSGAWATSGRPRPGRGVKPRLVSAPPVGRQGRSRTYGLRRVKRMCSV